MSEVPRLENFPGNRRYTHNVLVEDLALMERHLRDGSWKLCNCNPEKHLPIIAGAASEGVGFADGSEERGFMVKLRDWARIRKEQMRRGFSEKDAIDLQHWASEMRHRIEYKKWGSEAIGEVRVAIPIPSIKSEIMIGVDEDKGLYPEGLMRTQSKMIANSEIAMVYGVDFLGRAVVEGLELLDAKYPKALMGVADPSLVVDVVAAVGGVVGAMKLAAPYDDIALLLGGYLTTDLVRHGKKAAGLSAPARYSNVPQGRSNVPQGRAPAPKGASPSRVIWG